MGDKPPEVKHAFACRACLAARPGNQASEAYSIQRFVTTEWAPTRLSEEEGDRPSRLRPPSIKRDVRYSQFVDLGRIAATPPDSPHHAVEAARWAELHSLRGRGLGCGSQARRARGTTPHWVAAPALPNRRPSFRPTLRGGLQSRQLVASLSEVLPHDYRVEDVDNSVRAHVPSSPRPTSPGTIPYHHRSIPYR